MKKMKKMLAALLAVMMCVTMLPTTAFAWGGCDHNWTYTPASNETHTRKCTKCGTTDTEACEDKYCYEHGGYTGNTHNQLGGDSSLGDGRCDKCHATWWPAGCPSTGHEYKPDDGVVTTQPTCTVEGVRTFSCMVDGCTEPNHTSTASISALGHQYPTTWSDDNAGQNVKDGTHSHVCIRTEADGRDKDDNGKEAPSHTYGAPEQTTNGGVTTKTWTCGGCGHKYTETNCTHENNGESTWELTRTITAPGCETEGEGTYTCSQCGDTKTDSIAANGHDYTPGMTGAQDKGDGTHVWPCTRKDNSLDSDGHPNYSTPEPHNYGAWTLSEWADVADDDGIVRYQYRTATHVCGDCGHSETATFENPLTYDKEQLRQNKGTYSVTVIYVDEEGNTRAEPTGKTGLYPGESYEATPAAIPGWSTEGVAQTVTINSTDPADVEVKYVYTRNPSAPDTYNVTIYYLYEDGSQASDTYSDTMADDSSFRVTSPAIDGYIADTPVVTGTVHGHNVTSYVVYSPIAPVVIEESQPPLVETPEQPSEEPEVEIEESEPPLVEEPEVEPEVEIEEVDLPLIETPELPAEEPEVEIDDAETPLSDVPQTGDISLIWYAAAGVSGCGLTVMGLKKRKDEED